MSLRPILLCTLPVLGLSLACGGLGEPTPDVASPASWNDDGLAFRYPGNWTALREAEDIDGMLLVTVTIESSGSALAMVQIYPEGIELDLSEIAKLTAEGMQESIAEVSGGLLDLDPPVFGPTTRMVAGAQRQGLESRYTLELFGVKVPHTLTLYRIERPSGPILLYTQAADEDLGLVQPGFDLLLDSLVVDGKGGEGRRRKGG